MNDSTEIFICPGRPFLVGQSPNLVDEGRRSRQFLQLEDLSGYKAALQLLANVEAVKVDDRRVHAGYGTSKSLIVQRHITAIIWLQRRYPGEVTAARLEKDLCLGKCTVGDILQNHFQLIGGNGTNYDTFMAANDLNINFDIKLKVYHSQGGFYAWPHKCSEKKPLQCTTWLNHTGRKPLLFFFLYRKVCLCMLSSSSLKWFWEIRADFLLRWRLVEQLQGEHKK